MKTIDRLLFLYSIMRCGLQGFYNVGFKYPNCTIYTRGVLSIHLIFTIKSCKFPQEESWLRVTNGFTASLDTTRPRIVDHAREFDPI